MKKLLIVLSSIPVIFLLAFTTVAVFVPDTCLAQTGPGGLVNCNGTDCSACNLVELVNRGITILFGAVGVIFAIIMMKAGFGLVTSGGNPGALNEAKSHFQNAVIGFLIVMSAWLVVDIIMRTMMSSGNGDITGWGPWSEVRCLVQTQTQQMDQSELPNANGTPVNPAVTAACTDDAALIARYSGSPIGVEDPALRPMINCYLADPTVSSMTDQSQLYTIDRSHPRCSLTNGNTACGPCSHSNNSKHYGRGSGRGAQAVDFNARAGATENALYAAIQARRSVCGGVLNFETDHTHISLP